VTDHRPDQPKFKTCGDNEICCFTNATAGVVFKCCALNQVCSSNYNLVDPCLNYNNSQFATINLGAFGQNVVFSIAQAKSMFTDENLVVNIFSVTGSFPQYRDLKSGVYQMVNSAIDNTINYRFNDAAPRNLIPGRFDPIQIAANEKGGVPLQLYVTSAIVTYADFNGKRLGVDSPDTAFAFVAYKLLRINGLERDVNYTVISFGGTTQRLNAMIAGSCEGVMLNGDFTFRADALGFRSLGSIYDITTIAGGGGVSSTETWLKANRNVAVRFLKAYYKAVNYILNPANKAEVLAILTTLSGIYAEHIYNATVSPITGAVSDLNPIPTAIASTVELRKEFSGFQKSYPTIFGFDTTRCMSTIGGSVYTTSYLSEAYAAMVPPVTYIPPTQILTSFQQAFCLGFDLIAVEEETDAQPDATTGSASLVSASWLAILISLMAILYF